MDDAAAARIGMGGGLGGTAAGSKRQKASHGDGDGDGDDGTSQSSAGGDKAPTKWFRCADCDKSYSRVDHLARHVRQHTQERPYVCEICNKGFARADLLKRHGSVHNAPDGSGSTRKPTRQGRVNQACVACAELHLKCDNEKPCQRCKSKNIYCQYQARQADDEAVAHDLLSLSQQTTPQQQYNQQDFSPPDLSSPQSRRSTSHFGSSSQANQFVSAYPAQQLATPQSLGHPLGPNQFTPNANIHQQLADQRQMGGLMIDSHTDPNQHPQLTPGFPSLNQEFDGSELRDFLSNVMGQDTGMAAGFQPGTWTPRNLFELGIDNDEELNELDRDLLANYSINNPFGITPDTSTADEMSPESEPPMSGVEPMQKASTWRFRPASRDNAQTNSEFPANDKTRRLVMARRISKEPLTYVERDVLVGLVTAAKHTALSQGASSALPSVELLDSLLQFYLASAQPCEQFIHTPTFSPNKSRGEANMALLAAGAVLTPDIHVRKLGFAMAEVVRLVIPFALEGDNTLIRDIDLCRSAIIFSNIALWSGNSRRMEIAEGFLRVWVTMMRRGGWFRRTYEQRMPAPEDDGVVLERKWTTWAREESQKRMVFLLFLHDSQASISLFINPIISYADLHLPLPWPQDLWHARTAQAWKTLYLNKYQPQQLTPPSVLDLVRSLDRVGAASRIADEHVTAGALVSVAWGLVREYRQQSSILQGAQSQWSGGSLLLGSRLNEIKNMLECLRISSFQAADSALFLEILNMHLYIHLEDVHVFAGIEGSAEARRAYPALVEWVATPSARQAIWHAGQIVRFASQIRFIRDFAAVAVYQAGLALWCYGVISNASAARSNPNHPHYNPNNPQQPPINTGEFIAINGLETQGLQRFLAMNSGTPGLGGMGDGFDQVPLSNPWATMSRLIELLRASHRSTNSVPPLIENLVDLLGSLGAAVTDAGPMTGTGAGASAYGHGHGQMPGDSMMS